MSKLSDRKVAQLYSATFMMPMPGFCKVIDPSAINNHRILWHYISRCLYIAKPTLADMPLLKENFSSPLPLLYVVLGIYIFGCCCIKAFFLRL